MVWRVGTDLDALVLEWPVVITPALMGLDVLERRLPDALTLGTYPLVAALLTVDAVITVSSRPVLGAVLGLLLVGGFYLVMALVAPNGGLGAGDVKLAALIGMVMGSRRLGDAIIATIIGLVIAAIVGAATIGYFKDGRIQIAMGSAILSGALIAVLL